ncbi:MAG: dienelactone hydrolase family protein [Anaerolineae bacterium]
MMDFPVKGGTAPGYLALPSAGQGPGVMVLHTWWGLTEPFRRVCDRLAAEGFVALAPDLYHGKTTNSPEEAQVLGDALDHDPARWRGDIAGAAQELQRHNGGHGKLGVVGFSLGGAYALDMSVNLAEELAAVVIFYVAWAGPEFGRAQAAYLCHFADSDPFEEPGAATEMEQAMRAAGRPITSYRYPGTKHWFFEDNRPEYDAGAADLAWKRTVAFLHEQLD